MDEMDKDLDFSMFDEEEKETSEKEIQTEEKKDDLDFSMFDEEDEETLEQAPIEEEQEIPREARSGRELVNYQEDEPTETGTLDILAKAGGPFGNIAAGIGGVAMEGIEDVGDYLGLTEDAKLREQGFKIEDDYSNDVKGLADKFYNVKDYSKKRQDLTYDEHPVLSTIAELAGGIGTGGIAGKAALKYAPSLIDKFSKLSTLQKSATGLIGGATGQMSAQFGQGSERLIDPETGTITEDTLGRVADEATESLWMGAGIGGVIPYAGKILKKGVELVGDSMEGGNLKTIYDFAKKYGRVTEEKLSKARQTIAQETIDNVGKNIKDSALEKKGILKTLTEKLEKEGATFDVVEDLKKTIKELRESVEKKNVIGDDAVSALKLADDLENTFMQAEKQYKQLGDEMAADISKQELKSQNKQASAIRKAEGKAVMEAEKSGSELEMLTDKNIKYEEVSPLPYDTPDGEIKGVQAKLKDRYIDPDTGEEIVEYRNKKYLQDTTPFKASEPRFFEEGDEIVGEYINEATGEIIQKRMPRIQSGQDLTKISPSDLLEKMESYGSQVQTKGASQASREMHGSLEKKYKEMISGSGVSELDENIQRQEDILDIFKTDKDVIEKGIDTSTVQGSKKYNKIIEEIKQAPTIDEKLAKVKELTNLTPKEKLELVRNISAETQDVMDIKTSGLLDKNEGLIDKITEFQKLSKAQNVYTPGGVEGYTKAGRIEKAAAGTANFAGRTVKALNDMSEPQLQAFSQWVARKQGQKGALPFLVKGLSDPKTRDAAFFAASQQPAFRKTLEDYQKEMQERRLEE